MYACVYVYICNNTDYAYVCALVLYKMYDHHQSAIVNMYMYVCMYVCMYIHTDVCMYVYISNNTDYVYVCALVLYQMY